MAVSQGFADEVAEVLAFAPELRMKRMFGGMGIWSQDRMFALIVRDELFFKTDAISRPAFETEGCRPWTYGDPPRDMGYVSAPETIWDEPEEARRWAQLAIETAWRRPEPKRLGKAP